MSLDPLLIELLVDPVDHGELLYVETAGVLYNPRRRQVYALSDGIPVLLPDEATTADDAEHARLVGDPSAVRTGARRD